MGPVIPNWTYDPIGAKYIVDNGALEKMTYKHNSSKRHKSSETQMIQ